MAVPAIEVERVARTFGTGRSAVTALRDVSFRAHEGEVVGLLGANGAGKTTLTKVIGTLLLPTSGTVRVFGSDVVGKPLAARSVTGLVFGGDRGLYGRLTGRENLEFFAMVGGLSRRRLRARVDEVLAETGLGEAAGRAVETYSKGMRQRLHVAIGMIGNPRLLLLDEPTVGLDPVEAERLRQAVAALRNSGVTVLLTSHYLLDIERLADRVLLMKDGTISGDMTLSDFGRLAGHAAVVTIRGRGAPPESLAAPLPGLSVIEVETADSVWTARLRVRDWGVESFSQLSRVLVTPEVFDLQVTPVRLEDVYTQLTAVPGSVTAGG